jgi:hypothetical protein
MNNAAVWITLYHTVPPYHAKPLYHTVPPYHSKPLYHILPPYHTKPLYHIVLPYHTAPLYHSLCKQRCFSTAMIYIYMIPNNWCPENQGRQNFPSAKELPEFLFLQYTHKTLNSYSCSTHTRRSVLILAVHTQEAQFLFLQYTHKTLSPYSCSTHTRRSVLILAVHTQDAQFLFLQYTHKALSSYLAVHTQDAQSLFLQYTHKTLSHRSSKQQRVVKTSVELLNKIFCRWESYRRFLQRGSNRTKQCSLFTYFYHKTIEQLRRRSCTASRRGINDWVSCPIMWQIVRFAITISSILFLS